MNGKGQVGSRRARRNRPYLLRMSVDFLVDRRGVLVKLDQVQLVLLPRTQRPNEKLVLVLLPEPRRQSTRLSIRVLQAGAMSFVVSKPDASTQRENSAILVLVALLCKMESLHVAACG